ncbi:MAG: 3'(2'),5'-bisphosphate nucleotidase [Muricauda sp. TMED12]|nr:MAG: 3'(2'),5'-bisphosphate nucleotidase [Muricauda sp. TMED12]
MRTSIAQRTELAAAVEAIAVRAGEAIMEVYVRSQVQSEAKVDGSPVTKADHVADEIIVDGLEELGWPVPIVSEERSRTHAGALAESFWLVDPLDGTKEFLKRDGTGGFTINIALIEDGQPQLGVVLAPALERMFTGVACKGAWETRGGTTNSIKCRIVPSSGRKAVASASHLDKETEAWLKANNIADTVSIGSSLKFCLVACSEADVYPRFGPTMEWDTAAGDAVLRAAGGQVTTPDGHILKYGKQSYRNSSFIAWGTRSSGRQSQADIADPKNR